MNESMPSASNQFEARGPEQQRENLLMAGHIAAGWAAAFAEGQNSEDPILSILASEVRKLSATMERTKEMSDTQLSGLGMNASVSNVLKRRGLNTIGDLLPFSYANIRNTRNMSPGRLAELKKKLDEFGVKLRED